MSKKRQIKASGLKAFLKFNPMTSFCESLGDFAKDQRGNFATMFAVGAIPVIGFAGMGVELTRYSMVNENLTNALDASGLAIAKHAEALGYEMGNLTNQQKNDLRKYGRRFFHANFKDAYQIKNLKVQFLYDETSVKPQATGYMETSLLSLIKIERMSLDTTTQIALEGAGRLELALVLDVTGSMGSSEGSGTRMSVLKDAVYGMLDELYGPESDAVNPNVQVGVVPFNSVVNTGGTDRLLTGWLDYDAESMWHGHSFIHIEDAFDIDMNEKVNLFELYNSNDDLNWKGCVEARPAPLDELDTEPGKSVNLSLLSNWKTAPSGVDSSVQATVTDAFTNAATPSYSLSEVTGAEHSRFVPFFYPDEPDCDWNNGYDPCEYSGTYGYLSEYYKNGDSSGGYNNKNFIRDWRYNNYHALDWDDYEMYYNVVCQYRYNVNRNSSQGPDWKAPCSTDISSPTTDSSWSEIVDRTSAWYSYDHEYRVRQAYVGIYNPSTNKYEGKYDQSVSVYESGERATQGPNRECSTPIQPLTTIKSEVTATINAMTPGGTTNTAIGTIWGWRVLSPEAPFTEGKDPKVDKDWRKAVVIMTDGQNYVGVKSNSHNESAFESYGYVAQDRLNLDADTSKYRIEQARKTVRICRRMQAKDIKVYTVGFGISNNSESDKMLKACATDPEGDNKTYFLAKDADELKEAFREITEDLVNLHISG